MIMRLLAGSLASQCQVEHYDNTAKWQECSSMIHTDTVLCCCTASLFLSLSLLPLLLCLSSNLMVTHTHSLTVIFNAVISKITHLTKHLQGHFHSIKACIIHSFTSVQPRTTKLCHKSVKKKWYISSLFHSCSKGLKQCWINYSDINLTKANIQHNLQITVYGATLATLAFWVLLADSNGISYLVTSHTNTTTVHLQHLGWLNTMTQYCQHIQHTPKTLGMVYLFVFSLVEFSNSKIQLNHLSSDNKRRLVHKHKTNISLKVYYSAADISLYLTWL